MDSATKRRDRRPLECLLPHAILAELKQVATSRVPPTLTLAGDLNDRLELEKRYGVTSRRVLHFLKRAGRQTSPTTSPSDHAGGPTGKVVAEEMRKLRERQGSIASILESCFGGPATMRPELWEQRAYLMLIGLVYERLATSQGEITSVELSTLAKVLVDARRALGERKTIDEKSCASAKRDGSSGELPGSFRDAVRQVYGTALPDDREPDRSATGDDHRDSAQHTRQIC